MHADFRTKFRVLQSFLYLNGQFLTQGILGRQSLCHKMMYSMKLLADSSYFLILQTVWLVRTQLECQTVDQDIIIRRAPCHYDRKLTIIVKKHEIIPN